MALTLTSESLDAFSSSLTVSMETSSSSRFLDNVFSSCLILCALWSRRTFISLVNASRLLSCSFAESSWPSKSPTYMWNFVTYCTSELRVKADILTCCSSSILAILLASRSPRLASKSLDAFSNCWWILALLLHSLSSCLQKPKYHISYRCITWSCYTNLALFVSLIE